MALEDRLDEMDIKETIVRVFNNMVGGDYFMLRMLDGHTYELVVKDSCSGGFREVEKGKLMIDKGRFPYN